MLNIKGAFVLIGTEVPRAVVISGTAFALYHDRIRVVGFDKANSYTFGHTVTHALPCTLECMEFTALNYTGAHQELVRALCACIALRKPIGDGKDLTEGGTPAIIDAPRPKPNGGNGAHARVARAIANQNAPMVQS